MPTIETTVERELPCACLALTDTPFAACPQCDGTELSYQEITLEIEYTYLRSYRGARDRFGVPLEPDEDAYIEIESVDPDVSLTRREEDAIEQACLEDRDDRALAFAEARYDALHDR